MVRSKKWPFRAAVGMFLTVALVLMPGCGKEKQGIAESVGESVKSGEETVLYLDGSAVFVEEYKMLAKENSSQITMQYTTDQVNQKDFWETEIDGEAPYTRLAQLVEEQLKESYALKDLAVEMGLTDDYTYEELMHSMTEENEAREDTSGNEVSYGLNRFDDASYYKYWYSNLETQVVDELIQKEVKISESDCRKYYDENKENYINETVVKILYAEISESDSNGWNTARQVAAAFENGASAEEIEDALDISIQELELSSTDTQDGLSGVYTERWNIASGLQKGEVYGPYEDNQTYCVMKCMFRKDNTLIPFDDVKDQIQRYLQVQEAQQMIQDRITEMEMQNGSISEKEAVLQAMKSATGSGTDS